MHRIDLNGNPASCVALTSSSLFLDGWPSGPQAIFLEIAAVALFWLVLQFLFDSFNRPRGA